MLEQESKPATHEDILEQIALGQKRFSQVEDVLLDLKHSLASVVQGQNEFRETIKPISDDITQIKDMVSAWKAIETAGKFAKWIGGIAAALAAVWVVAKAGAQALAGRFP
jgi:hypothetical protein